MTLRTALSTIRPQQGIAEPVGFAAFNEEGETGMAAQTGKRYTCPKCGSEFIVTKGGDGDLTCGDTPLELKK